MNLDNCKRFHLTIEPPYRPMWFWPITFKSVESAVRWLRWLRPLLDLFVPRMTIYGVSVVLCERCAKESETR